MATLDLHKAYRPYYRAGREPEIVQFPAIGYIKISGQGEPGGSEFTEKIGLLYNLAYGIKKYCKEQVNDFSIPKLEGLWWKNDDQPPTQTAPKAWSWKLLIRMPDFVNEKLVNLVRPRVVALKQNALLHETAFEKIKEGKCVQIMHVGPYSTEEATINKLMKYIGANGMQVNGPHHEIYISDPGKTEAERLRTLIRYPVK